ncbi:MAG TPA: magnesium/cobalt transporter CorA [Tepidisphaeraceae bacterium]|nr:magnesium/cobalt transporter CorA [Tepidisphaeraceae bacterium]
MITAFIQFSDKRVSKDADPKTLAAALRDPGARFWVDMEKPTEDEISLLDDVFGFHPLAIEDTTQYSQRPKIESYNHVGDACQQGYFYMVIHGPDQETFRDQLRTKEMDMFVSERYLVTVHEDPMRSVQEVTTRANADARIVLEPGIDLLLHNILDHIIDQYRPILDYLEVALDDLEEEALTEPTPGLLTRIAMKKRELLNFRRIVGPQRDVLAQLTRGEVPFIRETTRIYLRDVQDHLIRTVEMIELYRDLVMGARDIYLSSVSNHLNQIMKTLTIMSVVALPMTVITSFFGMNFSHIPGLDSTMGFWLAVIFMFSVVAGMLYLFYRKKWI